MFFLKLVQRHELISGNKFALIIYKGYFENAKKSTLTWNSVTVEKKLGVTNTVLVADKLTLNSWRNSLELRSE
jgi:hypothetical protein